MKQRQVLCWRPWTLLCALALVTPPPPSDAAAEVLVAAVTIPTAAAAPGLATLEAALPATAALVAGAAAQPDLRAFYDIKLAGLLSPGLGAGRRASLSYAAVLEYRPVASLGGAPEPAHPRDQAGEPSWGRSAIAWLALVVYLAAKRRRPLTQVLGT
ncbi:hypothetical protein [Caldimonas brevitalea]|uniref:Uncharacterized protein n=1 Tax=Caldimonas brevitalea TaxID=413882 RepID=A0A0G3BNU7_9BURK|nr:hypothetical protein [Caldimonas brevitalea]AKJ28220.1 hypothetical protein AAW51_1529 [Caldimonas brevitalea]